LTDVDVEVSEADEDHISEPGFLSRIKNDEVEEENLAVRKESSPFKHKASIRRK